MMLTNTVLQYRDSGDRIRVIHESESKVFIVDLNKDTSMPKCIDKEKVEAEIYNEVLIKIIDPYITNVEENTIPEKQRKKRDEEWEYISYLWPIHMEELLYKNKRNYIIKNIAIEIGVKELKLKRLLTRFWQRGMNKNALLSDYKNSGARGKERNLQDRKVGRPKKADFMGDVQEGINITDDVKKIINFSINKFYRKKEKPTLKAAYNSMLKEFFSDRYTENGEVKHRVWSKERIPTYRQFYYWYNKYEDIKKDITFRESSKNFDSNYRPITGNSKMETDGPGTRYQIDATIADVYLVSSVNRNRVIGRPIVYMIIDVYSRLVTGIYTGLEGPSWMGAMMALDNMVVDKVEFCKKYGIDITKEQWPSNHLPEIIIADRGEFEGYSVEKLINNLNIRIENTPPYRGDAKGIVERSFRTTNEKIKHKTPGAIQKEFRQRGDRDYRLDATLTLEEFTQIIINLVLHHNRKIVSGYPMDKEMISDELTPTPINLWNWGIKNKKGRLKIVDRDIMRLNLLPRGTASISRAGLKFKKLFYSSQKAIEEQWFIKSKQRRVEVIYDPRNMDYIYVMHENGIEYEVCHLLEKSIQYKGSILEEILFQEELNMELIEWERNEQNQIQVDVDKEIEDIIKESLAKKKATVTETTSKSKQIKNIRVNRAIEKEINRQEESFKIGVEKKEGIIKEFNKSKGTEGEEKDTRKSRLMDKIRKKRDEQFGR
ncbi:MAG: transposase family protein [Anaeromicrobium sp.]|jgi:hypothetical protein|uniref:transposase n=1 Tax=Anaeromicrobium sp. TaxID=1929132 RepID=UPI002600C567|nr:transposase [Anaeromicrobium sp.]MCT4594618.1 transposase family protein [Anaeromicrobium sp.]